MKKDALRSRVGWVGMYAVEWMAVLHSVLIACCGIASALSDPEMASFTATITDFQTADFVVDEGTSNGAILHPFLNVSSRSTSRTAVREQRKVAITLLTPAPSHWQFGGWNRSTAVCHPRPDMDCQPRAASPDRREWPGRVVCQPGGLYQRHPLQVPDLK